MNQGRRPAQIRATLTTECIEELKNSGKAIVKRDCGGLEGVFSVYFDVFLVYSYSFPAYFTVVYSNCILVYFDVF